MKLLVTGGLGFIGSNFIINILKNHPEYDIVNLDDGKILQKILLMQPHGKTKYN